MDRLRNKVAIVTGGAQGIGAATVRRFCEEGARVVIADVNRPSELGEHVTPRRLPFSCDLNTLRVIRDGARTAP